MKLPRILILLFLCLGLSSFSTISLTQVCDKIEAQPEVIHTSNGEDNGGVQIKLAKGSLKSLKFIFCAQKDGRVLNENKFQQSSIEGLPPGDYFCIVSNDECSKKISFTIK